PAVPRRVLQGRPPRQPQRHDQREGPRADDARGPDGRHPGGPPGGAEEAPAVDDARRRPLRAPGGEDARPGLALRHRLARPAPHRFVQMDFVPDYDELDPEAPGPGTVFLRDATRTIIARNDSPDVGFDASVNPYRGCEHGCIYCFARPTHEYFGLSAGLDFET